MMLLSTCIILTLKFVKTKWARGLQDKSQPQNEFILSFQESFTISEGALLTAIQLKIQNPWMLSTPTIITRQAEGFKVPNAS